jgi:zinc transport system substrate-binding protein
VDPTHAALYEKRATATAKRFLALDQAYRQGLSRCRCRKLVLAGHAAFGYLARAYGLEMIALASLSPEAEPTPAALAKMIKLLKQDKVTAIFYEHPSARRFATVLARETGAKVFYLTPGASLIQKEYEKGLSFFDLMERNLKYLKEGLGCE